MQSDLADPLAPATPVCDQIVAKESVALAESLLSESLQITTSAETAQMARVGQLVQSPQAKSLSMLMTDRLFRSSTAERTAKGWRAILKQVGIGEGFGLWDRMQLRVGAAASKYLPAVVMDLVRKRLRNEARDVILSAEEPNLTDHLASRRRDGVGLNLNQLGEAVLGEEQAAKRLEALLALLNRSDVDYVSVKVSAIFSQINLVAPETTLEAIKERLRLIYRAALPERKFVNLDMEEYRDLALTVAAFREVLSEPEFKQLPAGLVLQAYLPDSITVQQELTAWAQDRVAGGGERIKVRIVKGANLAMETVEAELHDWNPAPHRSKHDTDAGFRRMLEFACQHENTKAVRIGVASHNLFDIALALVLRSKNGVEEAVEIEMLEGMAAPQSRAVKEKAGDLLVYAPVVNDVDFGSALAYLIRRLDENTSPGNFLASLFSLKPGSKEWEEQKGRFLSAWQHRHDVDATPRRLALPETQGKGFHNEPDSDWTQVRHHKALANAQISTVTPPKADASAVNQTLAATKASQVGWMAAGAATRAEILRACGDQIASTRFECITLLCEEGKKAILEADTEISEAIDFCRYYAETGMEPQGVHSEPLGTVVVTPPWNFPFAIPCGGVVGALMAGNAVILKPASKSARIGWWLVQQLWEAGVPREVLHYAFPSDRSAGRALIDDDRTNAVILTGAYETARMFQGWRPSLRLFAETSGKNALVISALADTELAAKDLVKSAFSHSGQKCSAASLGILEAEVYDDPVFRRQLRDAAASLKVGPSSDPASIVTPVILEPDEKLRRALTQLDEGEEWLLEPKVSEADPLLWSPGIKIGVTRGSWFHMNECFGPVLGLMRAVDLDEAVALQNDVDYGLTAGLHSLDETEIAQWKSKVQAGNLYINRGITGAIVQRQPFGGWKKSSIGPGAKAGGPNYVNLFRTCTDLEPVSVEHAREDYQEAWDSHFNIGHDPTGLRCESNVFRYRPSHGVVLRLAGEDERSENLARLAAQVTGTPLTISRASKESGEDFAGRLPQLARTNEFIRTVAGPPADVVLEASYEAGLNWIDAPMSASGRLELTRWTREQSVTETMHRYGNDLGGLRTNT
ncbi:MAG: bifunctional proline dehydrogenase/L-glutamate gamma-semialdehyde dehydrogenase [Verrucomicrobiaceae bacterium]|nr:bifunctional proline dehydrogenase/L-glutamate gamma-semialdehyde dehydrogenase [Verrucomicrobiaceae bacterium]